MAIMIQVVYTPSWFYGKDILIDTVSIFVLLLIAFFSLNYYKVDRKNKNYLHLAISFFLITLSFLFRILTNFTIYYKVFETKQLGLFTLTYQVIKSTGTLFFIGFLLHRTLMLLGLYMLYSIYQKNQSKSNILIISYLIIISTYFSQSAYYIFHVTSLILLLLITAQYYKNYTRNKNPTTKLLATSFVMITISQIFFMFVEINNLLYVVAELIQLLGYVILLFTFIKVLQNAKKKKQARHN